MYPPHQTAYRRGAVIVDGMRNGLINTAPKAHWVYRGPRFCNVGNRDASNTGFGIKIVKK